MTMYSDLGIYIPFKRIWMSSTFTAASQSSGRKTCRRTRRFSLEESMQVEQIQFSLLRKTRRLPRTFFTASWLLFHGRNPKGMIIISLRLSISGKGLITPFDRAIVSIKLTQHIEIWPSSSHCLTFFNFNMPNQHASTTLSF